MCIYDNDIYDIYDNDIYDIYDNDMITHSNARSFLCATIESVDGTTYISRRYHTL